MPSLIFLDEPTSGLDSVMSYEVMSFTSRLAEQNRTIVATIHQVRTMQGRAGRRVPFGQLISRG